MAPTVPTEGGAPIRARNQPNLPTAGGTTDPRRRWPGSTSIYPRGARRERPD
jgi:hypothetical protein